MAIESTQGQTQGGSAQTGAMLLARTPDQILGPFYPVRRTPDPGGDLTRGGQAAHGVRAVFQIGDQEHAELPGRQVGSVAAHGSHDGIT